MRRDMHVVILSDTVWKSRFQADPQIIGKTIRLDRDSWTIIGVLPAGFQHVGGDYRSPLQGDTVALWAPIGLDLRANWQRNWHFTNAVARLKPGVSRKAAEEDLNRIMDDLARRFPDSYRHKRARIEPLSSEVVGRSRVTVEIIAAGGALVLLVACINIAGLSVARVLARRQELAIRQALGGSTWRLIRAVLSESFIVGILGGLLGLGVALAFLPVLHLIIPANFPRLHEIRFSWSAAGFALTCALLTSTIAGLIPALRQMGGDPRENLGEDNRMTSGARRITSLRGGLVAAEVALSCILCFAAGLLVRSSGLLGARDHGFDPSGVLTFQLTLPDTAYGKPQQISAFYSEIVNRWKIIPGVRAAGLATNVPWTGYDENTGFDIVGRPARPGESIQSRFQAADPGFLSALRLRLIRGRWIEPGDQAKAPLVVVVNDALAQRYFGGADPIGRYLDLFGEKRRIAGIVADVRDRPSDAAAEPAFWFPLSQVPFAAVTAVLRTDGNPLSLVSAARAATESLDSELPLAEIDGRHCRRGVSGKAFCTLAMRSFRGACDDTGSHRNVRNAHLPGRTAPSRDRASPGPRIHAAGSPLAGPLGRREIGSIRNSCWTTDLTLSRTRAIDHALWSKRVGRSKFFGCAHANSIGDLPGKPSAWLGRGAH
jgi:predicted permease